nr:hypothetical protein [Tanacetum cinerariifolium]
MGFDLTKSNLCPSFDEDLTAKRVSLRVANSHIGNHREGDFTPLKTIRRLLESFREDSLTEEQDIQVSALKKKTNQIRKPASMKKRNQNAKELRCVPWATEEEVSFGKSWVHISKNSIAGFITQGDEKNNKRCKSSDYSSFNMRDLGEGNLNLNTIAGDEEDEVHKVCPSHPMSRDQVKRKWKGTTSSIDGVDLETFPRLMVNAYAMVNDPYNI